MKYNEFLPFFSKLQFNPDCLCRFTITCTLDTHGITDLVNYKFFRQLKNNFQITEYTSRGWTISNNDITLNCELKTEQHNKSNSITK